MWDGMIYLIHANKAMAIVTIFLVQLVKFLLPSPPTDAAGKQDRWKTIPQAKWFILLSAFLIGISLSILFNSANGQPLLGKIEGGLETGAFAIAGWEIYSRWIQPVISGAPPPAPLPGSDKEV